MIRSILSSLALLVVSTQLHAQQIIVNEFYRGGNLSTTDEWIEVVLLQDLTAAQLETFLIGDSQAATTSKLGAYQFAGMAGIATNFPAGTIILLAGTTGPASDTSFDPGNGDWNLVLKSAGANITTVTGGGDLAGTDVVWVDTVATGATIAPNGFCVNYDSTPGAFGAVCQVTIGVPSNNTGAVLGGDVTTDAATAGSWTVSVAVASTTPGQPNGGANTTSIDALRAGDPLPVLSIDSPSVGEGDIGDFPTLTFTATLDAPANGDCAFNIETLDAGGPNDATANVDYTATTLLNVTIADGQMSTTFDVPVIGDDLIEGDEVFAVEAFGEPMECDIFSASGTGTIIDDDFALPTLSIDDVSVVEGTGPGTTNAVFTVTLAEPPAPGRGSGMASVDYTTVDGSAVAPGDYALTSGTLNFSGSGSMTITVPIVREDIFENSEAFVVQLSNPQGATIADDQGQGTISNDDGFPVPSINDVSMAEGTGGTTTFVFTVTLSNPSSTPANFILQTQSDTAVAPDDYTAINATPILFAPLATSQTVNVNVVPDAVVEVDEQFFVQLLGIPPEPNRGSILIDSGTGTIVNDDVELELRVNDVTVVEGTGAGSTNAVFTVSLSGQPQPGSPVTVSYATADFTAFAPADYASTSGNLSFSAGGALTQTVSVPIVRDNTEELMEAYFLNLSNPVGAVIADNQGLGGITDDDQPPTLSVSNVSASEANGPLVFTLTLSNPSYATKFFRVWTVDGSATSPEDYVGIPLTPITAVNFAPGETVQTVSVTLIDDTVVESDESFVLNIAENGPPPTTGAPPILISATGTIVNDDVPALSITGTSVVEGTGGNSSLVFELSLSAPIDEPVSVDYATSDLTAVSPADYVASSGNLNFAATQTQATVSVTVIGDNLVEVSESFQLSLSNAVNATLAVASAIGTITDDDNASLSIDDLTLPEGSGGGLTPFTFTVRSSNPSATPIQVAYVTSNATAQDPTDFVAASGIVTIPALATSAPLTINVVADDIFEFDETFQVLLSSPVGATIADGIAIGTILGDEEAVQVPTLDSRALLLMLLAMLAIGGLALRRQSGG